MKVAVVKAGVGNTASVMFALERLGAGAVLTSDAAVLADAERIILPGVAAAGATMARLEAQGLVPLLKSWTRPLLGLCVGQQLLFDGSDEGDVAGLGFFEGQVRALTPSAHQSVPHMGWAQVKMLRAHPLTDGIESEAYFYFVHSYACPVDKEAIGVCELEDPFAAIVGNGNFFGCQFHPERSGKQGARILQNFLRLPC